MMNVLVEFRTFGLLIAVFFYFQGSKHVYNKYLRPFFLKHQAKIDRFLNILSKELVSVPFIYRHRYILLHGYELMKVILYKPDEVCQQPWTWNSFYREHGHQRCYHRYITGKTLYHRVHGILVQTIANRAGKDVKELLNWVYRHNK